MVFGEVSGVVLLQVPGVFHGSGEATHWTGRLSWMALVKFFKHSKASPNLWGFYTNREKDAIGEKKAKKAIVFPIKGRLALWLTPAFLRVGQRGFEPEYKRFSCVWPTQRSME
jgi:hypothetical protein